MTAAPRLVYQRRFSDPLDPFTREAYSSPAHSNHVPGDIAAPEFYEFTESQRSPCGEQCHGSQVLGHRGDESGQLVVVEGFRFNLALRLSSALDDAGVGI